MNVLLIAPDYTDSNQVLNQTTEIRTISSLHRTFVMSGKVRRIDLDMALNGIDYEVDIVHFAGHIKPDTMDQLVLSSGETMHMREFSRLCRDSGCKLSFLSMCVGAMFANFLVSDGLPASIYTTKEIEDKIAWELPVRFYDRIARAEARGEIIDFHSIFNRVNTNDGTYGWVSRANPLMFGDKSISEYVSEINKKIDELADMVKRNTMQLNQSRIDGRAHVYTTYAMTAIIIVIILLYVWGPTS